MGALMDWESPKLLLLVLPALLLLLWIEGGSSHPMGAARRRLLLVVRALGVLLALAALAGPARVAESGRATLGILVDVSQSLGAEGAARALRSSGKSLLPIGVRDVEGEFERGAVVGCFGLVVAGGTAALRWPAVRG